MGLPSTDRDVQAKRGHDIGSRSVVAVCPRTDGVRGGREATVCWRPRPLNVTTEGAEQEGRRPPLHPRSPLGLVILRRERGRIKDPSPAKPRSARSRTRRGKTPRCGGRRGPFRVGRAPPLSSPDPSRLGVGGSALAPYGRDVGGTRRASMFAVSITTSLVCARAELSSAAHGWALFIEAAGEAPETRSLRPRAAELLGKLSNRKPAKANPSRVESACRGVNACWRCSRCSVWRQPPSFDPNRSRAGGEPFPSTSRPNRRSNLTR